MEMQLQPNRWTCVPAAFAIATNTSITDIFDFIGHDGSEILWPQLNEPFRRRSFHIQEMIDYCLDLDVYPVEIQAAPFTWPEGIDEESVLEISLVVPIERYLQTRIGVICGEIDGNRHAVAWDRNQCFNPTGYKHSITEIDIMAFYAFF